MTPADFVNAVLGICLVTLGFAILRRRRPLGRWDYRPFGALAVFFGAIGLAFAVAGLARITS